MKALFIGILFFSSALLPEEPACDSLKLKTEITNTSRGENNGQILISVVKGKAPYKTYLFAENRKNNRKDFKFDELKDLGVGKYILVVQDGSGCSFEQTLKVK